MEKRRQLLPLRQGVRAAGFPAVLRLECFLGARQFQDVLAQHQDDVVAVEQEEILLAVVALLGAQGGLDAGEVRAAALGVVVERHQHAGAGGVGHHVGEVVEDVVLACLGDGLRHDLGGNVGVAVLDEVHLDAGQLLPLLGVGGHGVAKQGDEQDGERRVLQPVRFDVRLGAVDGALLHGIAGQGLGARRRPRNGETERRQNQQLDGFHTVTSFGCCGCGFTPGARRFRRRTRARPWDQSQMRCPPPP